MTTQPDRCPVFSPSTQEGRALENVMRGQGSRRFRPGHAGIDRAFYGGAARSRAGRRQPSPMVKASIRGAAARADFAASIIR